MAKGEEMTVKENATQIEMLVKNQTKVVEFLFGNGKKGMDEKFGRAIEKLDAVTLQLEEHISYHEEREKNNFSGRTYSDLQQLIRAIFKEYGLLPNGGEPEILSFLWMKKHIFPHLIRGFITAIFLLLFYLATQNISLWTK